MAGYCGIHWVPFQDSCYRTYWDRKTWNDARKTCLSQSGDLVTVLSAKEQQFVYETFGVGKSLWVGLRRNEKGVFWWASGDPVVYENWISGSPDDMNEGCGEMTSYGNFHGRWNDLPCANTLPFICERGEIF